MHRWITEALLSLFCRSLAGGGDQLLVVGAEGPNISEPNDGESGGLEEEIDEVAVLPESDVVAPAEEEIGAHSDFH